MISEEDLQRIFYELFKLETGNHGKIKITGCTFPIQVSYVELLEHDWRVKIALSPAKKSTL